MHWSMSLNGLGTALIRTLEEVKKKNICLWFRENVGKKAILFQDETDLLLFPPLLSTWEKRGHTTHVNISGYNDKQIIFGTINVQTGHRLFMEAHRQRGLEFQEFLKLIRKHYRRWDVALLLDSDPSHVTAATLNLAYHLGIDLVWLPVRSPKLNAMDHLWRHAKENVCANRQYESMDDQVLQFFNYLHSLSNHEALIKSGLMSGDFWLFK
jgi:hypothetical protein